MQPLLSCITIAKINLGSIEELEATDWIASWRSLISPGELFATPNWAQLFCKISALAVNLLIVVLASMLCVSSDEVGILTYQRE
jgi:hypothetical protein